MYIHIYTYKSNATPMFKLWRNGCVLRRQHQGIHVVAVRRRATASQSNVATCFNVPYTQSP